MCFRKRIAGLFVAVVAILTFTQLAEAQAGPKPKPKLPASNIDPGSTEGSIYTNKTLGIRIVYPSRMVADSREELDVASQEGLELYKQWDGEDVKIAETLANRERSVFGINMPKKDDDPFASLSLSVSKDTTGGELEPMVTRFIKMLTSAPNIKLVKAPRKVNLAGLTCFSFELSAEISGITVRSTFYSTRRKAHLLSFAITHFDDRGLDVMEKVLREIELF
ncbi:MAG: hypothetical protein KBD94_00225 [Pyrinomonadaceae bacterium]|nr:hypothetical protein [Pyrinomonadaceae bacterium]